MSSPRRALILSGGGARGAYQVGVLKALVEESPRDRYPFDILTGVSVGALNAAVLGSWPDDFARGVSTLESVWRSLHCDSVYRTSYRAIMGDLLRWGRALSFGWAGASPPKSLLDNAPLRDLVDRHVNFETLNRLGGPGGLKAIAITASSYRSGRAVAYFESSRTVPEWGRARRIGINREIRADHVMASSALPLVFPAVDVGGVFFGDGALRENAPLSTAIRLGADRVLTIAARDGTPDPQPLPKGTDRVDGGEYPSVGDIAGHMLDILFNDNAESDVETLGRINNLLGRLPAAERTAAGMRMIDYTSIEPTSDIRPIAGANVGELPKAVRFVVNILGGMKAPWVLPSYLMFEPGYINALIDLGYHDGRANADALAAFVRG